MRREANLDKPSDVPKGEEWPQEDALTSADFDEERLTSAYADHFNELASSLRSLYGAGPPDPDDIVQQAFVRVSQRATGRSIKNLKNYLWITARNLMVSAMRAETSYQRAVSNFAQTMLEADEDPLDPERVLLAKRKVELIFDCLRQMPERRRTIFILCRIEGLTPAEAGRRCGVSRSSAVRHVAIAINQIVEALSAPDQTSFSKGGTS